MRSMSWPKFPTMVAILVATFLVLGDRGQTSAEPPAAEPANPLPPGAVARLGSDSFRHGDTVRVLAFTPDGKGVISGGFYQPIRLWDTATGRELRTFGDRNHDF